MRRAAICLLAIGGLWLSVSIFLGLAMASLVGGAPTIVSLEDVLYVAGLVGGPLVLIAGAALVLRSPSRVGAVLVALASLDLTGWAAASILRGHLQSLTVELFAFYFVPLAGSLIADFAAGWICRQVFQKSA